LLHRSGGRWSSQPISEIVENWDERLVGVRAVWGSASDDVWFAGDTFLHFGNDGFKEFPLLDEGGAVTSEFVSVQALWGSGPNDIWAVDDGWIMRWDGTKWTLRSERAAAALRAVGGSSASDVWAVGVAGCAMHWDGRVWSNCREHATGIPTSIALNAVWSRGENDTFAAGGTFLLHQAGADWTARDLGVTAPDFEGTALYAGDDATWIGGYGLIARADEGGDVSYFRTHLEPVNALFGLPSGEIWAVGSESASSYFDGASWSARLEPATTATFSAIWAVSETCVWAATDNGTIFRFDGNGWTQVKHLAAATNAIWAGSEDDIWIAGSSFWHWDGAGWQELPIDDDESEIESLWGASSDEVWAIGGRGGLFRLDGNDFVRVEAPTEAKLESIWGSGPNDIWLTAADDGPWHWDGSAWSSASIVIDGEARYPTVVTGSSASDVWFLGSTDDERLEVTHWTGSAWVTHDTPALARVAGEPAAWVGTNCELWVLGDSVSSTVAVGHLAGAEWQMDDSGATSSLQAITGTAGELWAAGAHGTLVRKRVDALSAGSSCGTGNEDPLACEPGVEQVLTEPCGACDAGTRRRSRTCTEQRRWSVWTIGECENVEVQCLPGAIRCCQNGSVTGTQTCSSSCQWSRCVSCSFECAC
jgi:hypothetical protein